MEEIIGGNVFDKYRSKNPVYGVLVRNYLKSARRMLAHCTYDTVLEVGCGPGDLAARLFFDQEIEFIGLDICAEQIDLARTRNSQFRFLQGSAYSLPWSEQRFDLAVACEVLEHLQKPQEAINEILRVTKCHCLVSVPWEPVWRILNLLRGKYVRDWGNTPGHVQHFSRGEIRKIVSSQFDSVLELAPFPWTMILGKRR